MAKTPNGNQQHVIEAHHGPHRVAAGPGSGKTWTLTERAVSMLKANIDLDGLLVLTFSNKATEELRERLYKVLGRDVMAATYHSFAANLMAEYMDRRLKLLSAAEVWVYLDRIVKTHPLVGFDESDFRNVVRHAGRFIQCMQQELLLPENIFHYLDGAPTCPAGIDADAWTTRLQRLRTFAAIYQRYQDNKQRDKAQDFGDQILEAVRLLWTNTEARLEIQARYPYLMVDEYQDTNLAQGVMVALLIGSVANILVVGDQDQSIYGFQGATPQNIERFASLWPLREHEVHHHTLDENYRSLRPIVEFSREFIKSNRALRGVRVACDTGPIIEMIETSSADEQANYIAHKILMIRERPPERSWKDFAVLARNRSAFPHFRRVFQAAGIPFQITGKGDLLDQPEARDVVAYSRLLHDPGDAVALVRALTRQPMMCGHATIRNLVWGSDHKSRVLPLDGLDTLVSTLPADSLQRIQSFKEWVEQTRSHVPYKGLRWMVHEILEYTDHILRMKKGLIPDPLQAEANLNTLLDLASEMDTAGCGLEKWNDYLDSLIDQDEQPDTSVPDNGDTVKVLTLHAAKGLEWPVVFVVNAQKLPADRKVDTVRLTRDPTTLAWDRLGAGEWNDSERVATDLDAMILMDHPSVKEHEQEERRLAYVGFTRAEDRLIVMAHYRGQLGATGSRLLGYHAAHHWHIPANRLNKHFGQILAKRLDPATAAAAAQAAPDQLSFRDLRFVRAQESAAQLAAWQQNPPRILKERREQMDKLNDLLAQIESNSTLSTLEDLFPSLEDRESCRTEIAKIIKLAPAL